MNKKTIDIEHAAKVLKDIKADVEVGVFKDLHISELCNMDTGHETGLAFVFTLSTKYDYPSTILDKWRKRLDAEDYVISVSRNQLKITFNVMYRKDENT